MIRRQMTTHFGPSANGLAGPAVGQLQEHILKI